MKSSKRFKGAAADLQNITSDKWGRKLLHNFVKLSLSSFEAIHDNHSICNYYNYVSWHHIMEQKRILVPAIS